MSKGNGVPTKDNLMIVKIEVKESIIYDDLDDIGGEQDYEYHDGWIPMTVQLLAESILKDEVIKGLDSDKQSKTIFSDNEYKFKRGDIVRFYGNEEYLVRAVRVSIDPQYAKVIRMFPNAKKKYEWQRIDLKE